MMRSGGLTRRGGLIQIAGDEGSRSHSLKKVVPRWSGAVSSRCSRNVMGNRAPIISLGGSGFNLSCGKITLHTVSQNMTYNLYSYNKQILQEAYGGQQPGDRGGQLDFAVAWPGNVTPTP